MLPPRRMSAKINSVWSAVLFVALILAMAGCTPAGPRALLKGKKYLDRGDYADAVAARDLAAYQIGDMTEQAADRGAQDVENVERRHEGS